GGPRRRRRGPTQEEESQEPHRVREVDLLVVVRIEGGRAERRRTIEEQVAEREERVGDVAPPVAVGIAADELLRPEAGGREHESDEDDDRSLAPHSVSPKRRPHHIERARNCALKCLPAAPTSREAP